MTAKSIPEVGQWLAGHVPAIKHIAHVTFGAGDTTVDVVVGDTGAYQLFDVTRPIVVTGLWTQVATAFTASVTCTIGDTGSADRYIADTTMAPASSGAVLVASTGLTVPYVDGTGVDINVTVAGATAAAGVAHVYLEYVELED